MCSSPPPSGLSSLPDLILLYTEPIYRLGALNNTPGSQSIKARYLQPSSRFGYVDDTSMVRVGDTLEDTTNAINSDVAAVLAWGEENGVNFDPEKTEVMHFSRRRDQCSPAVPVDCRVLIDRPICVRMEWMVSFIQE